MTDICSYCKTDLHTLFDPFRRIKIEARPMMLIEVEVGDDGTGSQFSAILQNA